MLTRLKRTDSDERATLVPAKFPRKTKGEPKNMQCSQVHITGRTRSDRQHLSSLLEEKPNPNAVAKLEPSSSNSLSLLSQFAQ